MFWFFKIRSIFLCFLHPAPSPLPHTHTYNCPDPGTAQSLLLPAAVYQASSLSWESSSLEGDGVKSGLCSYTQTQKSEMKSHNVFSVGQDSGAFVPSPQILVYYLNIL